MTVLVGIACKDGVVLGSDSSSTFAAGPHFNTIEQPTQKTYVVEPDVIFAGTGQVGLAQRFHSLVRALRVHGNWSAADHFGIAKFIATSAIEDFASTHAEKGQFGALVAFVAGGVPRLCEFAIADLQPEFKVEKSWFVSMGSGQPITDPFLGLMRRVFFRDETPTVREGVFLTCWALEHAIDVNPGGIDGPSQIGVLQQVDNAWTAQMLDDDELREHVENVWAAERHLASYISPKGEEDLPPPPAPPVDSGYNPRTGEFEE